jgi:hypothetical protein
MFAGAGVGVGNDAGAGAVKAARVAAPAVVPLSPVCCDWDRFVFVGDQDLLLLLTSLLCPSLLVPFGGAITDRRNRFAFSRVVASLILYDRWCGSLRVSLRVSLRLSLKESCVRFSAGSREGSTPLMQTRPGPVRRGLKSFGGLSVGL